MLLPFACGLPSLSPVGSQSSENGKKTGYLSNGGSHVSSDSEVSLLAAQEGDWRPGPSGDLECAPTRRARQPGSGGGREVWSVDAPRAPPGVAPPTPRPASSLGCALSGGQGAWAPCVASVVMGPVPGAVTALLLQSHRLRGIFAFPETGREGICPDVPSPVGGLVGRGRGRQEFSESKQFLVICIFF